MNLDPVYRGMTQAALDAAYDNRGHVSNWQGILARWAEDSARLYRTRPVRRDLAYGPDPRNRLDFFPASIPGRPTMLYIHGGYWQWLTKEEEAFVAEGPLAHDINVALCDYRLCPNVRVDDVVADVRAAADWLQPRLLDFGADPERLIVAGSSAGAHLAAMLLGRRTVTGALLISGLYDLAPVALLSLNAVLGLDAGSARRLSPAHANPACHSLVCFAVGAAELPEMRRQTGDYYATWIAKGGTGWQETLPDADHFTILDALARPDGALTHALLRLCGLPVPAAGGQLPKTGAPC